MAVVCYKVPSIGARVTELVPGGESGGDQAVKQSLAYIQLERQNERLKEALIRFVNAMFTSLL